MKHTTLALEIDGKGAAAKWKRLCVVPMELPCRQRDSKPGGDSVDTLASIGGSVAVIHYAANCAKFTKAPTFCTMTAARRLFPDLGSYTLHGLVNHLDLEIPPVLLAFSGLSPCSLAAVQTDILFNHIYGMLLAKGIHPRNIMTYHITPQWQPRIMWGKHQGLEFNDVPDYYVKMALGWPLDIDSRYNLILARDCKHAAAKPC